MSYPLNYPTPQNANVQIFNNNGGVDPSSLTWIKPQGASFVWFTLIGGGGDGNNTTGGGSGAVTNFMCPAFLIPDQLNVRVSQGGTSATTSVKYIGKANEYTLLSANNGSGGGGGGSGGTAMVANRFTAMGFFQSIDGQNGVDNLSSINPSATTFLSGGGATSSEIFGNYGYWLNSSTASNRNGIFQTQPIIVGMGGAGTGRGGIGCGGGVSGKGGHGLCVIITW